MEISLIDPVIDMGQMIVGGGMGGGFLPFGLPTFRRPSVALGDLITGEIVEWPAAVAPAGWLLCDGTLYAEAAQPALFLVIGATFIQGGDPAGFFRVPDCRGRIVFGAGSALPLGFHDGLAEAARNPISHGHAGNITYGITPKDAATGADLARAHGWQSDTGFTNFSTMAAAGATAVALGDILFNQHAHLLAGAGGTGWGGTHTPANFDHAHAAGGTLNARANWPSHIGLNYIIYAG